MAQVPLDLVERLLPRADAPAQLPSPPEPPSNASAAANLPEASNALAGLAAWGAVALAADAHPGQQPRDAARSQLQHRARRQLQEGTLQSTAQRQLHGPALPDARKSWPSTVGGEQPAPDATADPSALGYTRHMQEDAMSDRPARMTTAAPVLVQKPSRSAGGATAAAAGGRRTVPRVIFRTDGPQELARNAPDEDVALFDHIRRCLSPLSYNCLLYTSPSPRD